MQAMAQDQPLPYKLSLCTAAIQVEFVYWSCTCVAHLRCEAGLWWLQVLLGRLCIIVRLAALFLALKLCRIFTITAGVSTTTWAVVLVTSGCMLPALKVCNHSRTPSHAMGYMPAVYSLSLHHSGERYGYSPHSCSATCVNSISGGRPCCDTGRNDV